MQGVLLSYKTSAPREVLAERLRTRYVTAGAREADTAEHEKDE
jgi:hypothetical protein